MVTDPRIADDRFATIEPPEPSMWIIDTVHSFVTFRVWHQAVSYARGMAAGLTGVITIGHLADSEFHATVDASSVRTLHPIRDAKVHGGQVLDVEEFPRIEFTSCRLSSYGDNHYELGGRLSPHGVTRNISLNLVFNRVVEDNSGKQRLGVTVTAELLPRQLRHRRLG